MRGCNAALCAAHNLPSRESACLLSTAAQLPPPAVGRDTQPEGQYGLWQTPSVGTATPAAPEAHLTPPQHSRQQELAPPRTPNTPTPRHTPPHHPIAPLPPAPAALSAALSAAPSAALPAALLPPPTHTHIPCCALAHLLGRPGARSPRAPPGPMIIMRSSRSPGPSPSPAVPTRSSSIMSKPPIMSPSSISASLARASA